MFPPNKMLSLISAKSSARVAPEPAPGPAEDIKVQDVNESGDEDEAATPPPRASRQSFSMVKSVFDNTQHMQFKEPEGVQRV